MSLRVKQVSSEMFVHSREVEQADDDKAVRASRGLEASTTFCRKATFRIESNAWREVVQRVH